MVPGDHQWEPSAARTGESWRYLPCQCDHSGHTCPDPEGCGVPASLSREYLCRYGGSSHQEHLKLVSVSLSLDQWSLKWAAWPLERIDRIFFKFISCKCDKEHFYILSVRIDCTAKHCSQECHELSWGKSRDSPGRKGCWSSFLHFVQFTRTWVRRFMYMEEAFQYFDPGCGVTLHVNPHNWCSRRSNSRDEMGNFLLQKGSCFFDWTKASH